MTYEQLAQLDAPGVSRNEPAAQRVQLDELPKA
jgi:hypothetical protein